MTLKEIRTSQDERLFVILWQQVTLMIPNALNLWDLNEYLLSIRGSKGSPPKFSVIDFRCHEWPGGSNWQYINKSKWPIYVWNLKTFKIHLKQFMVLPCNVYVNTPKEWRKLKFSMNWLVSNIQSSLLSKRKRQKAPFCGSVENTIYRWRCTDTLFWMAKKEFFL